MTQDTPRETLDRALLAVGQDRDRAAFRELYSWLAPRLRAWLHRGGTPTASVDELVQDTMLTVWQRAPDFDPTRGSATGWIFTIARNRKIDRLRRERRPEPEPEQALAPSQGPRADDQLHTSWRQQRLHSALEKLPEEQLAILQDAYFLQISQREIAKRRGLPEGTVKSRLRLAMQRLRQTLPPDSELP